MPHIHELYDFVNSVYIVHDNKVLLVNHPRYGLWIPIGGHIELDEHPDQTLVREVAEETGLTVRFLGEKPDVPSRLGNFMTTPHYMHAHDANAPHRHIALVYFAVTDSNAFVLSDEHTAAAWVSEAELTSEMYHLTEDVVFLSRKALKAAKLDK
ncbi:MAG: hydrolase [Candidatus Saccharibacteria bacterium]|nr:hydrolase [Candidatus Saccharibacteria bacterium]